MELKNAVAVCLISLFSATLVVLVVRALESDAVSRLEPQLTSIVEELQAIRKQGTIAPSPDAASDSNPVSDGLVVYYFHNNYRCVTCRAIEQQTKDILETDFAAALSSGAITWKVLNYQKPSGVELGRKFEVTDPVVVLARMQRGQLGDWKRLDKVMALTNDKPGFFQYVHDEIAQMLVADKKPAPAESNPAGPAIPVPSGDSAKEAPAKEPVLLPVPD
jgi:hypothetical protein